MGAGRSKNTKTSCVRQPHSTEILNQSVTKLWYGLKAKITYIKCAIHENVGRTFQHFNAEVAGKNGHQLLIPLHSRSQIPEQIFSKILHMNKNKIHYNTLKQRKD